MVPDVYAARAPIHETFRVYVDRDGVLRTDHDLRMWAATAVRLHYKLEPKRDVIPLEGYRPPEV